VLALAWPSSRWTLVDSRSRSIEFVREAAQRLALGARVAVVHGRAELVGRDAAHRGRHDLVVSRGFGPPAATAECAAPLLEVGGRLIVSEPPGSTGERWPTDALEQLGLALVRSVRFQQATFAVLEQARPCPSTYPRRVGVPEKRLLFSEPDVSRETESGT
jgi:16S rRNA (guanine527-N7)-methyltransferase